MSHEDETTPNWKTEVSFERNALEADGAGDAVSAWEQELSRWSESEDAGIEAPPSNDTPPVHDPAPEAVTPAPDMDAAGLDHSWLTKPLEEVSEPLPAEVMPHVEPFLEPVLETDVPDPYVGAPVIPLPTPSIELPVDLPADLPEPSMELPVGLPAATTAEAPLGSLPEPETDFAAIPELVEQTLEPAAKVPFYKRELSLKRAPRDRKPKAEKRQRKQKAPRKPKEAREPKAERGEDKVPFYKRQLSLKRTKPQPVTSERTKPERAKKDRPKLRRPSLPKPELGGGKNSRKLIGLKIGASHIAAARVLNGDSPQLLQAVSSPLEHGVVVGGELRDPEALAVALQEFFKHHGLPKRGIRLGIANNRIGVRTLDVVGIEDPKQLDNAIKFRAQEVLPIPLEDAVLDYQVLSESIDADGQTSRRVLLVVAYRDLVDRYVDACRKAGLQIVGIDLEAFALLRALAEPQSQLQPLPGVERGALVAVAVGHDRSTFAISDGRICEFTRVLQWGGWSLNVAIARALDTSPSEAEVVKRALSFTGQQPLPQGFSAEQLETAREAARSQLQTFARELVSSLQFYQNQPGSLGIGEIVVTGGTSHLPGFGAELERLVGVPVRIGDPLSRVKLSKGVAELEQVGSLAVAIGLGIED
jgi:type IV pilus assembly protein PilM